MGPSFLLREMGANSRMSGIETSRAEPPFARGAVVREWLAFLRRPTLNLPPRPADRRAFVDLAWLLLIDAVIVAALIVPLSLYLDAAPVTPVDLEKMFAGREWMLALFAVLLAPVAEEIVFRGWLPLHWRALGLSLSVVAALIAGGVAFALAGRSGAIVVGCAALLGWFAAFALEARRAQRGPHRPASRMREAAIPFAFYFSALAFAALHVANYKAAAIYLALPLVLPQFALGLINGFARLRWGMWANVTLHMVHNGVLVAMLAIATLAAG